VSLEQGLPHSLVTRMLLNDHYLAASVSDTGQASAARPTSMTYSSICRLSESPRASPRLANSLILVRQELKTEPISLKAP
jgi:hypothetical protein